MLLSKYGRKFFDEAEEGEGASSGTAVAEAPQTAAKPQKTNGAEARSPFGASTGMSDEEFQAKLKAAIKTVKSESGNANVDIDTGEVTRTPLPKKAAAPKQAKEPVQEQPEEKTSRLSDSVRSQLREAYNLEEDELDDFEDDDDANRFMDRIDRLQSRRLKQSKAAGQELQKLQGKQPAEPEENEEGDTEKPEKRTIKEPVSKAQREIDRARGVESKETTREVTAEEYVASLRDRTVGVFENGNYEPEVVGAMTNLLDHIVFQDTHIRQMTQVVNRLMQQGQLIEQAGQRRDAENFMSLLDQHIGDVEKFGRDGHRSEEQWKNLELVYDFVNDLRNRRGDKSLTQALVLRAASLAFDGKLRTRDQRLRDQSRLRMGSSTARTASVTPTNPGQYRNDPSKNPVIAQKIAEIKGELGK